MAEQHEHVRNKSKRHSGTWVLITCGPQRLLGRVASLGKLGDAPDGGQRYVWTENGKERVEQAKVEDVIKADVITLNPNLDFMAPLRPVPKMGKDGRPVMGPRGPEIALQRDPVITTRDFSLNPYPTHVRNGPGTFFDFLSQMSDADQDTYTGFIESAIGKAHEEGYEKAGLVAPSNAEVAQHGRH